MIDAIAEMYRDLNSEPDTVLASVLCENYIPLQTAFVEESAFTLRSYPFMTMTDEPVETLDEGIRRRAQDHYGKLHLNLE